MTTVPRIELIASLSIATDLALGSPLESGLGTCLVATQFASAIGLSVADARAVYHLALVRHIGCTADNHDLAATFGSEMGLHDLTESQDVNDPASFQAALAEHTRIALLREQRAATPPPLSTRPLIVDAALAACEVGAMLADRFDYGSEIRAGLLASYERWDGLGIPGRLAAREIPIAMRVVQIAEAAVRATGRGESPASWLPSRAGGLLDPELVQEFVDGAEARLGVLQAPDRRAAVVALEPAPHHSLTGEALDNALRAIGEFADLKSPYLVGHSASVATLAGEAASLAGLDGEGISAVRRAGWIHDLGRVSVSAATWGRPGALSRDEWERVRLHPYHTERLFDGARGSAGICAIASFHHERLDGSGYTRAASAPGIPVAARLLAAADVYSAMTEARPHREALSRDAAAHKLRAESRAGRLDGRAVEAVLGAAGHRPRRRLAGVAGLTAREIEVLGHVARGRSNREIAEALVITLKTVDAHVQHLYAKAGVTTRAGATVFAMEHGLVS